jgi:ATP/maltotriose-dependent transcriptional regulator MalT
MLRARRASPWRDREPDRAAAALGALGALRHGQRGSARAPGLGRHVYRRTRPGVADGSGLDGLSERELPVAPLIADRGANLDIADELFLSLETVERHPSHDVPQARLVEIACAVERASRAGRRSSA